MAAQKRAAKAASVEPETPAAEAAPGQPAKPVMSAGVASDLAMLGSAGDPATGGTWERDPDTGKVTHTGRDGTVTEL